MSVISQKKGQFRRACAFLASLVLALSLALALLGGSAAALEAEESAQSVVLPSGLELTLTEQDEPLLERLVFGGLSRDCYYLMLDGETLVCADEAESLTGLVDELAQEYITENTVSCALEDPDRLSLCYGLVLASTSTDLDLAAETLSETLVFQTEEREVREVAIPYAEVTETDDTLYEYEVIVTTEGQDGLAAQTWTSHYVNGELLGTRLEEETVLTPAVDEVTTYGTKERPEYLWPVEGRVSSEFGPRNIAVGSSNHKGMDIACPTGTDVLASKAGTVIFAGWSNGYGYLVQIEHEDGAVTYYGHNSSLLVSSGDEVEQGDVIALAGSTGRSTGPHCHFEIRIDGTPVNPRDYLE